MYQISEYKHGRCELFAIALHKMFGYPIRFYIDPEDLEMSMPVLIHACNVLDNNTLIDIDGKTNVENILDEFDYNELDIVNINSEEEAREVLNEIGLPYRLSQDEENFIIEYVKNNISKYTE